VLNQTTAVFHRKHTRHRGNSTRKLVDQFAFKTLLAASFATNGIALTVAATDVLDMTPVAAALPPLR
jgi:hypothetical protein